VGKRFVRVQDADKRVLQFYKTLREVEQMPLVNVDVTDGPKPILLFDANDPKKWDHFTIDGFLSLDIAQAKAEGGTFTALRFSRKKPGTPRLPKEEVDRAVGAFMTGSDDD
jgi:hypothetical protein